MGETVLSWSGGKDCSRALHALEDAGRPVSELLTTVNREFDRSTVHGVRRPLYERQADALGRPINLVSLPPDPSNAEYEETMAGVFDRYRERGISHIVFADIFLEDVRAYREDLLAASGIEGRWPLWQRDTTDLATEFIDLGFEAVVVAADAELFDASVVGRAFDPSFLADLPSGVDPCGENGEFHTFVWNGPPFEEPVPIEVGETVTRPAGDGEFHYADLQLTSES